MGGFRDDGALPRQYLHVRRCARQGTGIPQPSLARADVRSLAAKLTGLHALLTPGEQALLHAALRRAAEREGTPVPDTGGFAWAVSFNPFPYLDTIEDHVRRERHTHGG